MEYIYTEIKKMKKDIKFSEVFWLDLEYYKLKFLFSVYHVGKSFKDFLFKTKEEKQEEQDAEKIFECLH